MLFIIPLQHALLDFYQSVRGMEYLNYSIDDVLRDIFKALTVNGSIETAIDGYCMSIRNSIERPNYDGKIFARAFNNLAYDIYAELRTLDVWDSNGFLMVSYERLVQDDVVVRFTVPVHQPHSFRLEQRKPPKLVRY